ncbi:MULTISPECIES: endo alpha-1,4 polygalactosaminidase [unclassified Microbacterium]|uniref:endo alpha-1,4 polygalactosaminidase n=1 Tax=unclassified Microbacterium TaxID=2609290 RepID=UPI0015FF05CA|nr:MULTISPECIES: endo alpha-1,4 polygalactosaminidase [unclassified Microbacterium]MBT2483469.1 endo alpha-1,4 polygalactosaminidase [Microbacterium sp. ISL-108]
MLTAFTGCLATPASPSPASSTDPSSAAGVALPPVGAIPDYQLGGAYDPAPGVGIVGRDRSETPASDAYSICYVNGFQTQPGELGEWPAELLLHRDGEPVFDPDWPDEVLLDTSTADHRDQIAAGIIPWIAGCADAGFDAVEFDNLDSYTRSGDALSFDDNLALATLLVDTAHATGLAAGQKNAAEDAVALREQAGFDFALTEECAVFRECSVYTDVYGDAVIDIEYTDALPRPFAEMCADEESPASMVLRDRDLVTPADPAYAFETCTG